MEQYTMTGGEQEMALEVLSMLTPERVASAFGLFALLILWGFVWKGIALWYAARNNSVPWFVALLLINTLGILEIIYIFVVQKKQQEGSHKKTAEEILQEETIKAELQKMQEESEEGGGDTANRIAQK